MAKKDVLGRGVRAVQGWMLKVSHQVTASGAGNMDARRPAAERRMRDLGREPDRRVNDRRDIA